MVFIFLGRKKKSPHESCRDFAGLSSRVINSFGRVLDYFLAPTLALAIQLFFIEIFENLLSFLEDIWEWVAFTHRNSLNLMVLGGTLLSNCEFCGIFPQTTMFKCKCFCQQYVQITY